MVREIGETGGGEYAATGGSSAAVGRGTTFARLVKSYRDALYGKDPIMSELFADITSGVVGSSDLAASGNSGSFRVPLSSALMLEGDWHCRLHSIQFPQTPDKNSGFVSCDFVHE